MVKPLVDVDGKAGAPADIAIKRMGFSGLHGASRAALSALKKFKLIEYRAGRVLPSEEALIILKYPADHPKSVTATRACALNPAVYRNLVSRYASIGELPSDESLAPELEMDFDFNPKMITGFLRDFRDSLKAAGMLDGNQLNLGEGFANLANDADNENDAIVATEKGEMNTIQPIQKTAVQHDIFNLPDLIRRAGPFPVGHRPELVPGPTIRFDLPRGNTIEIRLKAKLTKEEFAKVQQIFTLSEFAFVEDQQGQTPTTNSQTPLPLAIENQQNEIRMINTGSSSDKSN
jgi:hypothetical protein